MIKNIKAFILRKLAPDYEGLKAENKQLNSDIYDLITLDKRPEGLITLMKYQSKFDLERVIWQGEVNEVNS